ncbi:TetR/AcrR family transcriptional regulator [Flavobacteriaceae bacterium]|nr:TetR/AcrR family transcriptional regulator [Flavobacteriaceae bacterium]
MKRKIYKEDVKKAGLEIMFLNGYNGTGIKDITDMVKIPKGSFYNHFTSKEDFALEVVQDYCDNGLEMYRRAFLLAPGTPATRIENFVDGLVANYSENLEFKLGCIMSNFSAEMSDTNARFKVLLDTEFNRCQEIMAQCIREGQDLGEFKKELDSSHTAAFMLNSLHGAFIRMKTTGNESPLVDFKQFILTLLHP